jgi:hypothetical protein
MFPSAEHEWWVGTLSGDEVITATAYAVTGDPTAGPRMLTVTEIKTYGATGGAYRDVILTVRNTGGESIPGYSVSMAFVKA